MWSYTFSVLSLCEFKNNFSIVNYLTLLDMLDYQCNGVFKQQLAFITKLFWLLTTFECLDLNMQVISSFKYNILIMIKYMNTSDKVQSKIWWLTLSLSRWCTVSRCQVLRHDTGLHWLTTEGQRVQFRFCFKIKLFHLFIPFQNYKVSTYIYVSHT